MYLIRSSHHRRHTFQKQMKQQSTSSPSLPCQIQIKKLTSYRWQTPTTKFSPYSTLLVVPPLRRPWGSPMDSLWRHYELNEHRRKLVVWIVLTPDPFSPPSSDLEKNRMISSTIWKRMRYCKTGTHHPKIQPSSLRSILRLSFRRISPNRQNHTSLHTIDTSLSIRYTIHKTFVRFVVALNMEERVKVKARGNGADYCEEEGRTSAYCCCGVTRWIEEG